MFDLGVFVALVVVGSVAGCIAEARHYASIRKWEAELAHEPPAKPRRKPPSCSAIPTR